jgi:hypothetical protein
MHGSAKQDNLANLAIFDQFPRQVMHRIFREVVPDRVISPFSLAISASSRASSPVAVNGFSQ